MDQDDDSVSVDIDTLQQFVNYLEATQAVEAAQVTMAKKGMEEAQDMEEAQYIEEAQHVEEAENMDESEDTEESENMEERRDNVIIDERFEAVNCYRNILGTASDFRLVLHSSSQSTFEATLYPLDEDEDTSPTLFVSWHLEPGTFKMCINDEYQREFVTFESKGDNVTVYSPEVAEPIGRVVRHKAEKILDDKSEIVCYATNMKFTMHNLASQANSSKVPSMMILDSNRKALAVGCVRRMTTTRTDCGTFRKLKEFVLFFDNSISEPTKVMFLVAFTNWARWSRGEADGRGPCRYFCLWFFVIFWVMLIFISMSK